MALLVKKFLEQNRIDNVIGLLKMKKAVLESTEKS